ncbi:outer membrane beta-barrel protein [Pontibacter sp. BT310]|uniref:Porin family protein n=2 Tax=Pontibacter TaxID=323449 RepID=A0ABS6XFQ2_9BACT|nr:DUF6089 family protein [Pontibacter populi]MBJ6119954.1 outer membrane beta-barrel protein [Pontibacter sp. BT310]MBW3366807.1 porin family protein [Pontibacter populi]
MTLHRIQLALLVCVMLQIGSAFFSTQAHAQYKVSTSEIGVGIGGANYKGELAPEYRFLNNQPALTVFYRRDLTNTFTARGGIMLSHRIADDNTIGDDVQDLPLPDYRQAELRLSLAEVSLVMEYNFLDYYDLSQKVRISPYFFAGFAGLIYNKKLTTDNPSLPSLDKPFDTDLTVSVPFGVGIKYALSKHWNLGLEFGTRILFNDNMDFLSEADGKHVANPYDKDWYYYNGISLSYTFYRANCPPPYRRQPGILD